MEVAHPLRKWFFDYHFWSNWNLKMLVYEERGKLEYLEKNLSGQGGTQPTYNVDTVIWTWAILMGGECSLSPLHYPCSPKCMNMKETKKREVIKKFEQQQCAHLCLICQIVMFQALIVLINIDVSSERCYSSIPCCSHLVSSSSCSNASHFVLFIGRKSFSLVVFRNQKWRRWRFYKS